MFGVLGVLICVLDVLFGVLGFLIGVFGVFWHWDGVFVTFGIYIFGIYMEKKIMTKKIKHEGSGKMCKFKNQYSIFETI